MRKHDWADELAQQIARDFDVPGQPRERLDLVAARLRVVRQEGIGIGIDQAKIEALKAISRDFIGFLATDSSRRREKDETLLLPLKESDFEGETK
jgi:hypothetical protein